MDEQVELLRGIWNEMKALNGRITTTNESLGELRTEVRDGVRGLGGRIDAVNESLGELRTEVRDGVRGLGERIDAVHSRAVERDMRLAGDLRDLKLDVRDLKNVALAWRDEHRADRTNLEERVERLERHVGIERA
jgi:hypothetical protein